MLVIFIRTILIYLILLCSMRLMGKRQIGELEVSDLVITLLLSDIATHPIVDPENPLSHAIIPIITLLATEVTLSLLLSRFPWLKNIGSARPNVLVRHGVIDSRELSRLRISVDELLSELRQKDITDLQQVDYAILEQNGKISVIPGASFRPLTPADLNLSGDKSGISHILISRGYVNRYNLKQLGRDKAWLAAQLREYGCRQRQVFLMTIDDGGKIYLLLRGKTKTENGTGGKPQ